MKGFGNNTLRGGQTVFHGLRMWGQLLRAALFVSAVSALAVPGWNIYRNTTGDDWYDAGMVSLAEFKLAVGYSETSRQEVELRNGTTVVLPLPVIAESPAALAARERLKDEIFAGAILGAKLSVVAIALFLALFWMRGRQLNRGRRIRGAELTTPRALERRVIPLYRRALPAVGLAPLPTPCRIAGVPFPARVETQHTIVSGTTGSGKTVLISDLVDQIRARGERCVIYDKMGSYTRSFFDMGRDILLNPLDDRAPRWSPFLEARSPRDFDMMAAALIPQQKDTVDPFWVTAARQLFANGAGVLWRKGLTHNKVLVDHLLKTELTALAQAMEGTVAQSIVDPGNPKTALSVRAMLTANLGALEYLPDDGPPFSIRDWIANDAETGFLFLTSRGDQHASLRGLISTWLEIAVNSLLSLDRNDGRRIWIVLDELPTLHQVPSLQPGLAESRQFGGCFVLGIQVISALRDLYGRNGAETISGLCGTRVVLAAPDRDTAQWSAESLGHAEVEEMTEAVSYGANTIRDGVSINSRKELRALALASEIMRLPSLEGYLRFPGPLPVAKIGLAYTKRPQTAERFVPRAGTADAVGTKPAAAPGAAGPSDAGTERRSGAPPGEAPSGPPRTTPASAGPPDPAVRDDSEPQPPSESRGGETGGVGNEDAGAGDDAGMRAAPAPGDAPGEFGTGAASAETEGRSVPVPADAAAGDAGEPAAVEPPRSRLARV